VGFEHAPRTDEQTKQVNDALALLENPNQLFSFDGATCTATETMVENKADDEHDEEHDDHDEGHDDHDDEHDKDHDDHDDDHDKEHDDHDDDHDKEHDDHAEKDHDDEHHDDHGEDESTHSEVLVMYTFECDAANKLTNIDVELLDVWSGFEDLDVQLIGPGGQTLVELGQLNKRIDITQVQ